MHRDCPALHAVGPKGQRQWGEPLKRRQSLSLEETKFSSGLGGTKPGMAWLGGGEGCPCLMTARDSMTATGTAQRHRNAGESHGIAGSNCGL